MTGEHETNQNNTSFRQIQSKAENGIKSVCNAVPEALRHARFNRNFQIWFLAHTHTHTYMKKQRIKLPETETG